MGMFKDISHGYTCVEQVSWKSCLWWLILGLCAIAHICGLGLEYVRARRSYQGLLIEWAIKAIGNEWSCEGWEWIYVEHKYEKWPSSNMMNVYAKNNGYIRLW
jgi:hypothetical protein